MPSVYLALGSNIGDRQANLGEAMSRMTQSSIQITRLSSIYETEPVEYLDQPWFLNAVLLAETHLSPAELLSALRGIESAMGSKKPFAKGPRLLDRERC